jgi:hypothetical protein
MRLLCVTDPLYGDNDQEILSSLNFCPKLAIFAKTIS